VYFNTCILVGIIYFQKKSISHDILPSKLNFCRITHKAYEWMGIGIKEWRQKIKFLITKHIPTGEL
jgi:hypothetical protein